MLEPLYAKTPKGFLETIRIAEEYVAKVGEPQSFMFWLRYASAQGQRARQARQEQDEAEFQRARTKALEAARKVLQYNREAGRYWLSVLSHPEHPDLVHGEDDLQIFHGDREFDELIGAEPYRMGERGPAAQ
jgi:hypothetical protein